MNGQAMRKLKTAFTYYNCTSLTGEHGEVSNVEKNEGTSNMQLIAIVLSILAIVSSVGTCVLWYVVKISN